MQPDIVKELPYIPKVLSKPTVVNSLEQAVTEQIPSEGCYNLVNFSNKNLEYKSIDKLLYGKGRTELDPTKNIYQGMLAKQGVTIVKLDMSNCNINSLGSFPLGQSLYENSNLRFLQHLNLSNNKITDDGIYSFGNQWFCKTSPSLRSLDLSNNLLTDNGANSLSGSFKSGNFYNLKKLDISGNNITLSGEKFIVNALQQEIVQDVLVTLKRSYNIKTMISGNKEQKQFLIKETLQVAQDNGVDVKNVAVSKSMYDKIVNFGKIAGNFTWGFGKCNIVPEDTKTFAAERIIAKASKKVFGANNAKDAVVCFFDTIDEVLTSNEGVQLIKDLDLFGANSVIDSIE